MPNELSREDLEALRRFSTPTISNAIETFDLRTRDEGYTDSTIRCLMPELGVMVAFACTATILTRPPAPERRLVDRRDYWKYLQAAPEPKVIVMQDLTHPSPAVYWGEVNANIHRALGCSGVITNGVIRDLPELRELGLYAFASGVCPSHAFAHLEDFNRPVEIGGQIIHSGDLIHADEHGCVVVPHEIARDLPQAAEEFERRERKIINICKSESFSIDQIDPLISPAY